MGIKVRSVQLPNFTVEEREDFLQVLKIMRIDADIRVTFMISVSQEADHEAMLLLLSEFERGRRAKT